MFWVEVWEVIHPMAINNIPFGGNGSTAPTAGPPIHYGVPAILARGLRKTYGEHVAVDQLDLEVRQGEILGFLGPNGAGKTTTIKMLTGLLQPTAGSAAILGHDIQREPVAAKALFGYVPDTPHLYGKLSGWEFVRFV